MVSSATSVIVVVLALSALQPRLVVQAFPGGAPVGACARIFPVGHGTSSQPLANSPYALNISALDDGYVPGETYMLVLSGTEQFRGLLVQARAVADDSPVGSFAATAGVTRLSSCERADSAVTHSSRSDKTSVVLPFTAPAAGTGPFRFVYAVVQLFSTFYAPIESARVEEQTIELEPIELRFTGDTPQVTGNDIFVSISVSRSVPLLCQLITRGMPGNPIITSEQNCTDGEVTFLNVEGGEHRVRVIAWDTPTDSDTVIRSRVVLMPDDSDFCSLNAINKGVTKTYDSNGMPANYTIEWRPIGNDVGFFCVLGDSDTPVECSSPFTVSAVNGVRRVKVLPDPDVCPGRRRPLVFLLD